MAKLGESDYRIGARERLEEAYILLRQERFGGSIYVAGRAVEGMLRAVVWKSDPQYATGKKAWKPAMACGTCSIWWAGSAFCATTR